mmetsp:Transcript_40391/g.107016  ORF Transcript_40391/g.107016 Transcript_40391/m.107016 type:complete len:83 (+) Transcript_40391:131-379(+)
MSTCMTSYYRRDVRVPSDVFMSIDEWRAAAYAAAALDRRIVQEQRNSIRCQAILLKQGMMNPLCVLQLALPPAPTFEAMGVD